MAMTVTNELMYELLKRMQQDIADIKHVQREHTMEFVSIRKHFVAVDGRFAAVQQDIINIQDRLDRIDERLSRVERRLELAETPAG
jgi:septal ring factor EnvC (AmiA/AmiB activator)